MSTTRNRQLIMLECRFEYNVSSTPIIATGVSYTAQQLHAAISGPVKEILRDAEGQSDLRVLLDDLATTDFEQSELDEVLSEELSFEDWLVGEALAETLIKQFCECEYPWPTLRDLKNSRASPAGCDLTGLQKLDSEDCPYRFAFGEVKTSSENEAPPSVMNGLRAQLFGLRDDKSVKKDLVIYLGRHSIGKHWQAKYQSAAKRYFRSGGTDIAIHGILVRDTQPNILDLRRHVAPLAVDCPEATHIELYAIYLPTGEISGLSDLAESVVTEEEAS